MHLILTNNHQKRAAFPKNLIYKQAFFINKFILILLIKKIKTLPDSEKLSYPK